MAGIVWDDKCYDIVFDSWLFELSLERWIITGGAVYFNSISSIKYNKIVTIEASGIAPAIMVGYLTNLPVVFVKKKQPKTMEGMITSVVHSFTKDRDYTVCVSNSYLTPDDHVIFIDDFLANGNASKGVMDLCEKAGAKIEAYGFRISFTLLVEVLFTFPSRYWFAIGLLRVFSLNAIIVDNAHTFIQ